MIIRCICSPLPVSYCRKLLRSTVSPTPKFHPIFRKTLMYSAALHYGFECALPRDGALSCWRWRSWRIASKWCDVSFSKQNPRYATGSHPTQRNVWTAGNDACSNRNITSNPYIQNMQIRQTRATSLWQTFLNWEQSTRISDWPVGQRKTCTQRKHKPEPAVDRRRHLEQNVDSSVFF